MKTISIALLLAGLLFVSCEDTLTPRIEQDVREAMEADCAEGDEDACEWLRDNGYPVPNE